MAQRARAIAAVLGRWLCDHQPRHHYVAKALSVVIPGTLIDLAAFKGR